MGVLAHRSPDQYYWVTSLITERDRAAEPTVCLLVAAVMATLGALPVALAWTPVGPQGALAVTVTVVIAAWTFAMAAMWGRRRWPTRTQSKVFFVGTVLAAGINTVLTANPLAALLGAVSFAVLSFYVVFLHGTGYMVFNVLVAVVVTAEVVFRLAHVTGVIVAACGFVFVMLVNLAAPVVCWLALKFVGIDVINPDVDLFTGCSTPDAFVNRVGELTGARARDGDEYLVLTVVLLDDLALLRETAGRASSDLAQVGIAQTVRRWTRRSAVVSQLNPQLFAIADVFNTADLNGYSTRILGALATTPPRMRLGVGIVRTPLAGLISLSTLDIVDQLVSAAEGAAQRAPDYGGLTRLDIVSIPTFPTEDG